MVLSSEVYGPGGSARPHKHYDYLRFRNDPWHVVEGYTRPILGYYE